MNISNSNNNITILTTGGTIEKVYNPNTGILENSEPIIESIINQHLILPNTFIHYHKLLNKDSLEISEEERKFIVSEIAKYSENNCPIIVVHGTDTLCQTAHICKKEIVSPRNNIIFTGSIKPYSLSSSDAIQNLTEAIILAKYLPPEIYISFHSTIFNPLEAYKDFDTMTFKKK